MALGALVPVLLMMHVVWEMNVLGYDPYVSVETAWTISSHVKRVDDLKEIITNADYITVHVPLTDKTRGLFSIQIVLDR